MTKAQSRWRKHSFDLAKLLCIATVLLVPFFLTHSVKIGGMAEHPLMEHRYLVFTLPATVIALVAALAGRGKVRYWFVSLSALSLFFWWCLAIDVDIK